MNEPARPRVDHATPEEVGAVTAAWLIGWLVAAWLLVTAVRVCAQVARMGRPRPRRRRNWR